MADTVSDDLTRRQVLRAAGAAAGLAVAGVGGVEFLRSRGQVGRIPSFGVKPSGSVRVFRSRPELRPPTVTASADTAELFWGEYPAGFLFLGPGPVNLSGSQQYGPLIVDRRGEPVWFRPLPPGIEVTNFMSSSYRGEQVLAWWEGKVQWSGYGQGEAVIVNRSYREVARVRAANGRAMDMHALWLTPEGTALFTCYPSIVEVDLSPVGGPRRGQVYESIVQEVDVASGRLLFEWTSLDHIPVSESFQALGAPYDYLHVNSIAPTPDGNLLVSGRHTWAMYKLDRRTGAVVWRLAGKRSDFQIGQGAQFAWQHDAKQVADRTFTVFDNASDGPRRTEEHSRGLVLDVDESARTVQLRTAYTDQNPVVATAMGSVQLLPSGDAVVGWGTAARTSAFTSDGAPVLDAALPRGLYSYRSLWLPWRSKPRGRPAVKADREQDGDTKLIYASWNGATEVAAWRVDAGPAAGRLRPIGIARRHGFETVIPLDHEVRVACVTALDRSGHALRRSHTVRL